MDFPIVIITLSGLMTKKNPTNPPRKPTSQEILKGFAATDYYV